LGCVDDIVPEPLGGAHLDPAGAAALLDAKLEWHMGELTVLPLDELIAQRRQKFRKIASFFTT
jgi:acetyl-CoA carboxylase carboxyl transferase subunit alpha